MNNGEIYCVPSMPSGKNSLREPTKHWKAGCVERCLSGLEQGKDCKILPIATITLGEIRSKF